MVNCGIRRDSNDAPMVNYDLSMKDALPAVYEYENVLEWDYRIYMRDVSICPVADFAYK